MKDRINKLICALMMTSTLAIAREAIETPIFKACADRNIPLIDALVDGGEDVNYQNENGCTALHYAVFFQEIDIAKCLIINGADINIKDARSRTPLSYLSFDEKHIFIFNELHELYQSLSRDPVLK